MKILRRLNRLFNGIKQRFTNYMCGRTTCKYAEILQNCSKRDGTWRLSKPFKHDLEKEEFDRSSVDDEE